MGAVPHRRSAVLLGLDQGTTGTTCLVLRLQPDGALALLGRSIVPVRAHFAQPGWVEHDLHDIWRGTQRAIAAALQDAGCRGQDIAAVGLTTQRETVGLWQPDGTPSAAAIVWQDRRTAAYCDRLREAGHEPLVRAKTGLRLDPYFSASKMAWMLQHDVSLRARAAARRVLCGTMDAWLVYKLTGGKLFATDATNAARTCLYDIHRGCWDAELCALFDDIPQAFLPEVRDCDAGFGTTLGAGALPDGIPIAAVAGDQHAALFGQGCVRPGEAKCTLGTGAFVLMHTGAKPVETRHGLLTTLAWRRCGRVDYALEGGVFVAGALVQWLRDGLGFFDASDDIEALAAQVPDAGGVTVVPALAGLGAPHWRPHARGLIAGITRGTKRAHIARAALEGIAWQVADLMDALVKDSGAARAALRVDGGAAKNDLLVQFLADVLATPVHRPAQLESTAVGAAAMAASAMAWRDDDMTSGALGPTHIFSPSMSPNEVRRRRAAWADALSRA